MDEDRLIEMLTRDDYVEITSREHGIAIKIEPDPDEDYISICYHLVDTEGSVSPRGYGTLKALVEAFKEDLKEQEKENETKTN